MSPVSTTFPRILVTVALSLLSSHATAAIYSHTLRGFGQPNNAALCDRNIQDVAQRFAADAQVEVLGAACEVDDIYRDGLVGRITYAAAQPAKLYNTDARSLGTDALDHYATLADCQAGLVREQEVLTRLTGLVPFSAYCYTSRVNQVRYRARLDAVGESDVRKGSTGSDWRYVLAEPDAARRAISALGDAYDWTVVETSVGRGITGWAVTVDYYAKERLHMHTEDGLRWGSLAACKAKSAALLASWSDEAPAIAIACDRVENALPSGQVIFWVSPNIFAGEDMRIETLPTAYASEAVCDADRSRVETALDRAGTVVFGTVCGQDPNQRQTRMMIFSKVNRPEP